MNEDEMGRGERGNISLQDGVVGLSLVLLVSLWCCWSLFGVVGLSLLLVVGLSLVLVVGLSLLLVVGLSLLLVVGLSLLVC